MSRISEALKQIRLNGYISFPTLPHIERYVQTGDPNVLATIKPAAPGTSYVGSLLTSPLRTPETWQDEDRRLVHAMAASGMAEFVWTWLSRQLGNERTGQDFHAAVRQELSVGGMTESEMLEGTLRHVDTLVREEKTTSAGRWLLTLPPEKLKSQLKRLTLGHPVGQLAQLVMIAAPERAADLADLLLSPGGAHRPSPEVVRALLKPGDATFAPAVLAAYERSKDTWTRFHVARVLFDHDAGKFRRLAFDAARASLEGGEGTNNHGPVSEWLLEKFGREAVPVLEKYFRDAKWSLQWGEEIVNDAGGALKEAAVPVLIAALDVCMRPAGDPAAGKTKPDHNDAWRRARELDVRRAALEHLIALREPAHDARILTGIRDGLAATQAETAVGFINLAGKWDVGRLEEELWGMTGNKAKTVRDAAARALAKLGDVAVPKAAGLLRQKKADVRSAAVALLGALATPAALAELEARLDDEPNDDVRDQILGGLTAAWEKQGRTLTRQDITARVAKAAQAGKLKEPVATWADPAKLPALKWKDEGTPLSRDAVAYLLYRQSRASQIKPDVEAAPLYRLIDRASSGEFARAVLRAFLGSKQDAADRWALALAGLLGDDRLVPELIGQVREWVEKNRGKLAEYAVQALALLGTDAALLAVDAMAIRYRTKMKNVGRAAAEAFAGAAEHLGISADELGDRVVPWLGFEPGKPRIIDAGKTKIEATIGTDLKLAFKDVDKQKAIKSLPKTASPQVQAEFKEISANLKEVAKAQVLRLENLLVRQRRWPASRWQELFLGHPLLLPFAVRLVWGHYDESGKRLGTFRALEDRSLTTREDEPYDLPRSGSVGMVHPLDLDEDERLAWQTHLADYEIEPPFPQLEREVVTAGPEIAGVKVYRDLAGTSINAMTFKGRAERLGWSRGSVVDAGCISSYYKSFPGAGVDVFLGVEDFFIGIDMYSDMKLGEVMFVKHGTVKVGSYTYDEPADAKDPRVIAMGEAPPVVFSEAMGDLQKIAGKKPAPAGGNGADA